MTEFVQCATLAPTVRLEARIASEEDKKWLAGALYQLHQPSTGSLEGDVLKLSELIDEYVLLCFSHLALYSHSRLGSCATSVWKPPLISTGCRERTFPL